MFAICNISVKTLIAIYNTTFFMLSKIIVIQLHRLLNTGSVIKKTEAERTMLQSRRVTHCITLLMSYRFRCYKRIYIVNIHSVRRFQYFCQHSKHRRITNRFQCIVNSPPRCLFKRMYFHNPFQSMPCRGFSLGPEHT